MGVFEGVPALGLATAAIVAVRRARRPDDGDG